MIFFRNAAPTIDTSHFHSHDLERWVIGRMFLMRSGVEKDFDSSIDTIEPRGHPGEIPFSMASSVIENHTVRILRTASLHRRFFEP